MSTLRVDATDRILIFAPHPDDESLATGGLIQRALRAGASVRIVFATDGDNNPWPQRVLERRWKIARADRARWGKARRREALRAMRHLGLQPGCARFLGMPDQGLGKLLLAEDADALSAIFEQIEEWQPTLVIRPSRADSHPDHKALSAMVQIALLQTGLPSRVLDYLVHRARWHGKRPKRVSIRLGEGEVETKRGAILCHKTQVALSKQRFLAHAREQEIFYDDALSIRSVRRAVAKRARSLKSAELSFATLSTFLKARLKPASRAA